jgi:hypothetical protein
MAEDRRTEVARDGAAIGPPRVAAVVTDSARLWRRDLRTLTALAAGLELPLLAADVVLHITPGLKTLTDDSFTLTGAALVVFAYGSLSHHFLAGLLERIVAAERRGHHRPTLGEILRDLPWHRLVVADVVLTAIVAAGLALFVIPGLVALTWFSITLPIVNLERNPVLASFRRSYHLVRGQSWRVFGIAVGAFALPEVAIGLVATITHHHTDDVVLNAIGHAVPAIILMPIAALPIVILAFDLVDLDAARLR